MSVEPGAILPPAPSHYSLGLGLGLFAGSVLVIVWFLCGHWRRGRSDEHDHEYVPVPECEDPHGDKLMDNEPLRLCSQQAAAVATVCAAFICLFLYMVLVLRLGSTPPIEAMVQQQWSEGLEDIPLMRESKEPGGECCGALFCPVRPCQICCRIGQSCNARCSKDAFRSSPYGQWAYPKDAYGICSCEF